MFLAWLLRGGISEEELLPPDINSKFRSLDDRLKFYVMVIGAFYDTLVMRLLLLRKITDILKM
jgi:hypothetical protein